MHSQRPNALQDSGAVHAPQSYPHIGSCPHSLSVQSGMQAQVPSAWQVSGAVHSPQEVPHTGSLPHSSPVQTAMHSQAPSALQVSGAVHVPQLPLQPSSPQSFPAQEGWQHWHSSQPEPSGRQSWTPSVPPRHGQVFRWPGVHSFSVPESQAPTQAPRERTATKPTPTNPFTSHLQEGHY